MKINNLKIFFVFFIFAVMLLASIVFTESSSSYPQITVHEGNNLVKFNVSNTFYVKDLVKLNPEIEVVSYNSTRNVTGFVNIFGGVGKNFYIENNTEYEIYSSGNATLIVP